MEEDNKTVEEPENQFLHLATNTTTTTSKPPRTLYPRREKAPAEFCKSTKHSEDLFQFHYENIVLKDAIIFRYIFSLLPSFLDIDTPEEGKMVCVTPLE